MVAHQQRGVCVCGRVRSGGEMNDKMGMVAVLQFQGKHGIDRKKGSKHISMHTYLAFAVNRIHVGSMFKQPDDRLDPETLRGVV